MIQQSIRTRKALLRIWAKRALPGIHEAFEGPMADREVTRLRPATARRGDGAAYAGARRAEFAVLTDDGRQPVGEHTCDPLEAHRWLHEARKRAGGGHGPRLNAPDGLCLGWRAGSAGSWRRHGPLLLLPELTLEGGRLDLLPLVAAPLPASPRAARARLRTLLRRGGLDAPAAVSLLDRYEGYFPNIEVGAAQILHARLGGDLSWLCWLDLRAMLWDLISSALLWTLPDRGTRGWPAGLHVFTG